MLRSAALAVLTAVVLALAATATATADARPTARGAKLEKVRAVICGKERRARRTDVGTRVVVRGQRRLKVQRCKLGRWKRVKSARRRAVLDTSAPADYRVRDRRGKPRIVRVGVGEVVDVPVAFDVVNTNTSAISCATDGEPYVIRGFLVAPAEALAKGDRAATLLVHGVDAAGYLHLTQTPDVDFAAGLAARGRSVVVVDRLGYRTSDRPPGDGSCLGGQADTTRQVLEAMRAGTYRSGARRLGPAAFARVGLLGHSGGTPVAQVTAYSYPGLLQGLIIMAWSDRNFEPALFEGIATGDGPRCGADPSGYGFVFNLETWRRYPEARLRPEVLAAAEAGRSANPCGDLNTITQAPAFDTANLGSVTIPVLTAHGRFDVLFGDGEGQGDLYTGSDDVTALKYDGGHSFLIEDALAAPVQDDVAAWLAERGL